MPFQKKELFGHFGRAVFMCAVFLVLVCIAVFAPLDEFATIVLVLLVLVLIGQAVFTCKAIAQLLRKISEYKYAKETDILDSLKGINAYANDEEMRNAFDAQKDDCVYNDGRIIITKDFLADTYENYLFLINGIIDAESDVYNENGTIQKVILSIIYLDGERYKMVYHRSDETTTMRNRAKMVAEAVALIANTSVNFRKYLPPKN